MQRQRVSTGAVSGPCAERSRFWRRGAQGLTCLVFLFAWSLARGETAKISVPKSAVAAAFNVALNPIRVHIDNYGKKRGTSWHEDHSFILLPDGSKKRFHIDEIKIEITARRQLKDYLRDINSQNIRASVSGNRIQVQIFFESQGEEVKVHCVRKRLGRWKECTLDIERDIHLDNTFIEVSFAPVARKGSISLSNPKVTFKTDVRIANRLCQTFRGICGKIERMIKTKVTKQIEDAIRANLSSPKVKDAVADAVRNANPFRQHIQPAWRVTDIASRGNQFILTVQR